MLLNQVAQTNPLLNPKPVELGIGNYSENKLINNSDISKYLKLIGKRTALGSLLIPSSGAGSEELAWEEQNMRRINSAQDVIDNHLKRDVHSSGAGYIFTPPEQEIVNTELPLITPEYQTYDESFVTPDSRVIDQGFITPDTQFQDEGFITPSSADMTTLYNKGLLDNEVIEDGLLSETAPPFYSRITKTIEDAKMNKASGDGWLGMINNSGVNQEELDWIGMKDFLADKKSVTKEEILDFARMNDLSTEVKEVILGDKSKGSEKLEKLGFQNESSVLSLMENIDSGMYPKVAEDFENWVTVGGGVMDMNKSSPRFIRDVALENYIKNELDITKSDFQKETLYSSHKNLITEGDYTDYKEMTFALPNIEADFTGGHYKSKNIFAHARFNTRDIDGKKTLFIEELQSDWVHKGKEKGYALPQNELDNIRTRLNEIDNEIKQIMFADENLKEIQTLSSKEQELLSKLNKEKGELRTKRQSNIPNLPFKKNWQDIVLKRLVRYAAENGFDAIAMTGGNIQKDRYDLSTQLDSVVINPSEKAEGKIHIQSYTKDNLDQIHGHHIYPDQLEEYVGKELAEKIKNDLKNKKNILEYKGLDLQVGGEGLGEMYDKIFNKSLKKIGKKHGAEVELKELNDKLNMWYMNLTDSLKKQSIEAGMPIAFNKPVNPLFNYA